MGRGEEGEVTSPFIGEFCEVSKARRTRETQDGAFFGCFLFFCFFEEKQLGDFGEILLMLVQSCPTVGCITLARDR